jgi:hypothetical protein
MLLTHRPDVAEHQLDLQLFNRDIGTTAAHQNEIRKDAIKNGTSTNKGAVRRFTRTRYSRSFETLGRVYFNVANQPKLLPPNTELKIRLTRADNKFALMARTEDHDYKVVIDKAELIVAFKRVNTHVVLSHEEAFLKMNAKYPIVTSEIRYFGKGRGLSDLSEANIITNSSLPQKVIVGLVETSAFTGNHNKNPFCFIPANAKEISLRVNTLPVPYDRIETDFPNGCYAQGYFTLLQATNRINSDKALQIKFGDYAYGNTLYAFDISPDFSESSALNLRKDGNLSLHLSLRAPTDEPMTVIVYMEFMRMIEIDRSRNVQIY